MAIVSLLSTLAASLAICEFSMIFIFVIGCNNKLSACNRSFYNCLLFILPFFVLLNVAKNTKYYLGIDFVVDPTPITTEDRKKISEVIAYYKATGKKMPIKKAVPQKNIERKSRKKVLV